MMKAGDQWLEARGLDIELAAKMGWDFINHKEIGPSVKIPYYRGETVVNTQYRAIAKKDFRFTKGAPIELWNVNALKDQTLDGHPLVIAEGACDGLALMQCGYQRVVAIPGWSDKNFDPANYAPFTTNEADIKRAGRIIVAQHADNTGATMLRAISNYFDESHVAFVKWPAGCKDANDCLRDHGQDAVVRAVSGAIEVDPAGGLITGFSDAPPRPEQRIWRLDYPEIDKVMAFRSGTLTVFTGIPGSGKTTFMTWATNHLIKANGLRVGLCLFETSAQEVLLHLARLHGKQTEYMTEDEWDIFKAELDINYRIVHRVDDPDPEVTHGMKWLRQIIHKLAARDHCQVIIVDPWNELAHEPLPGETMTSYINLALSNLYRWAQKYDINICIVAHPRKMNGDEKPTGYHISDSAAWMNKADMGWTIAVEKATGEGDDFVQEHVSLTNWKVRNVQETGCHTGYVRLNFNETSMNYTVKSR